MHPAGPHLSCRGQAGSWIKHPVSLVSMHMIRACDYAFCMTSLQIRNLPDHVHRTLKARAALAGQSLSEYAQAELLRAAERPTRQEIVDRIRRRAEVVLVEQPADAVRDQRDR